MPTVIECERWDFDPEAIDTGFQPNTGETLATQAILESMDSLRKRPEMKELVSLIKNSAQYAPGRKNA